MSINDLTQTQASHSKACITQEKLDSTSSYTHVYICSVIHQNPIELRRCLQLQFSKLSSLSSKKENPTNTNLLQRDKEDFEYQIESLDLSEAKDPELHLFIPYNATEEKRKKVKFKRRFKINYKLYFYTVLIALFSLLIQLLLLVILIYNCFINANVATYDAQLILIRFISFITVGFSSYMEYRLGRMKLNHAIKQKFLYQNSLRRCISGFFGLMQMIIALMIFCCHTYLIIQTNTVFGNVQWLTSMLVLSNLHNWIGNYFLQSNTMLQVYTRGVITQIWCELKGSNGYCDFLYVIETFIYAGVTF